MKVIRAGVPGFCEGVRRAVEMAWQASSGADGRRIYTLGALIHNSRVLQSLGERGVVCLEEDEISVVPENSIAIIRAHGVSPQMEAELVRQGLRILDATCPHVKASQEKARAFAKKGYRVFLAGEKNHAEIEGVRGYVSAAGGSRCFVIGTPDEAEKAAEELFRLEPASKTALIGQTTFNAEEFRAVGRAIRKYFPGLELVNTICGATAERQKALRELCANVDAVIIVGSRESANTRRLLSLARELGKPAWLAETPADIPPEIRSCETVGLSAGASTPDELVTEVEKVLTLMTG